MKTLWIPAGSYQIQFWDEPEQDLPPGLFTLTSSNSPEKTPSTNPDLTQSLCFISSSVNSETISTISPSALRPEVQISSELRNTSVKSCCFVRDEEAGTSPSLYFPVTHLTWRLITSNLQQPLQHSGFCFSQSDGNWDPAKVIFKLTVWSC